MLLAQIGELSANRPSTEMKFDELKAAIGTLKRAVIARATMTKQWADKIEALSGKRIEARLNEDKNWSEILDALDALSAKTGSQTDTRHQRILDKLASDGPWPVLDALRADSLAALRWKQMASGGGTEKPTCEFLDR